MKNRNVINDLTNQYRQMELAELFAEKNTFAVRIKDARIRIRRINGMNVFRFERGAGLRRHIMTVPLSDAAVDAIYALRNCAKVEEE